MDSAHRRPLEQAACLQLIAELRDCRSALVIRQSVCDFRLRLLKAQRRFGLDLHELHDMESKMRAEGRTACAYRELLNFTDELRRHSRGREIAEIASAGFRRFIFGSFRRQLGEWFAGENPYTQT